MTLLVGIDESSGTQDTTLNGATSNDVSVSRPALFTTALNFETLAGSADPVTALALSGATTPTSSGTQVITFSGTVLDVGFTTAAGAAVVAQDSGLTTTATGLKIFLYTSTHNNNVMLGREANPDGTANASGAVAFALYLDTGTGTASDAGATGAKLWVAQFEAVTDPDATTANDFVSLAQDLFVSVNTLQNFSMSGAPSGNNLFLMFGDGTPSADDVTIVVTGKNPANQSTGANVSSGDTVVSSQGGIGDTTIGTNNQMVDPGEGMYFTFVKGANTNFTIPNLDATEANVEANIDFTQSFSAFSASFLLSQLQPPKGATVKVTALHDPTVLSGVNFVDSLNNDSTAVNISTVVITRTTTVKKVTTTTDYTFTEANNTAQAGISVDFSGASAQVTGLVAGDRLKYIADGSHERLLVENAGSPDAQVNSSFDIGGFRLESGSLATFDLGNVAFIDDGPTASAALGTGSVTHDETAGLQSAAGANDTTDAAVIALFSGVTNKSTQLATAGYAHGSASVVNSSASNFGSDGQAASGATSYSLSLASTTGVDSGLTTLDSTHIFLFKEGDLVVGRIGTSAGAAAFAVAIEASTGVLSMVQYSAVKHPDATASNESIHLTDGSLQAVVTIKDGDGDLSTASVNIGNEVRILDDAPSASAALGTGSVVHDETAGVQSAAGANDTTAAAVIALFSGVTNKSTQLATAGYAQGSASVVNSSGSTFGSDGAAATGATSYSLSLATTTGVDSGLTTDAGTHIFLFKEGSLVVGRIGNSAGAAAFAVSIDSSSGVLSMAQYSAVSHTNTSNPNDSTHVADSALQVVVTVKDGDGDLNTASVNIGNEVVILDDGPALAFGNVVGTGTVNPQYGTWSMAAGSDGLGANGVDISMTAFQLVKPDSTVVTGTSFAFSETSPSPDGSGNYHFTGSVTGDLDNNAGTADTTEHFLMTVSANGTYNIDLVEGFQSTVTESTATGTLGAGGPDAVQTLTVGTDHIVFFSAKPLASAADLINLGTKTGADDFTEAQLESAQPAVIDFTKAMNVSTSGIGNGNNNLDGDATAAISSGDEAFVANPGTQFTSVKVFVDNSVTGYDFSGGERLYYRFLYSDGTDSGQVLIGQNLATTGGKPQSITLDGGGKLIDALELTMGTGTVKIPEIQFITSTNNLADGLKLSFTASIADGDGDSATSAFGVDLAANAPSGTFDFVLNGAASALDWFNVDLTQSQTKYQVNGFDTGATRDKLVLLGDAGATFTIDNSGADALVAIHETGGQTTNVTVVGVDLLGTDITLI
jgi:hypothetical protein